MRRGDGGRVGQERERYRVRLRKRVWELKWEREWKLVRERYCEHELTRVRER